MYFVPNVLGALCVGYIFQYLFTYILPALGEMAGSEALSHSMLSGKKHGLDCYCDCLRMAGSGAKHHYLYFRASDGSRGCLRSWRT